MESHTVFSDNRRNGRVMYHNESMKSLTNPVNNYSKGSRIRLLKKRTINEKNSNVYCSLIINLNSLDSLEVESPELTN